MARVGHYIRGVYARARLMFRQAADEVRLFDLVCILAAAGAVGYMVFNSNEFGQFAKEGLASRTVYQGLRGILIAIGILILVDRRANSTAAKLAVTLAVVGLCANVAENTVGVNPQGIPLKFGYLSYNLGTLTWFLSLLFRVPWQQRAERLQAELDACRAKEAQSKP